MVILGGLAVSYVRATPVGGCARAVFPDIREVYLSTLRKANMTLRTAYRRIPTVGFLRIDCRRVSTD